MNRTLLALLASAAILPASAAAPVEPPTQPPAAVARPVTDDYFGTKVTDRFRYMESRDAETTAWMKAQSAWAHGVLDSIKPKAAYLEKMSAFGSQFGLVSVTQVAGDRVFYLERAPGADQFNLRVLDHGQARTLVDTAALMKAHDGTPYAIDWFQASHDGSKVAVGISTGGSENSQMSILDAASGQTIAGPIDRAQFGGVDWLPDGSGLFFTRLQKLGPNPKPTDKYQNITADFWDLKGDSQPLFGPGLKKGPITNIDAAPVLWQVPHSDAMLLIEQNGVQNEVAMWWGRRDAVRAGTESWKPFTTAADGITRVDGNGRTLFLLSHKDAPRFKVMAVPVGGSLAEAQTVIPASEDRLIDGIGAAADGLYVTAREGLYSKLLRVSNDGKVEEIALPVRGSIEGVSTDPDHAGAIVALDSWASPLAHYRYDPATRQLVDLKLDTHPPIDASRYQVSELWATAKDGTKVPLTVIGPSGPIRPRPVLLDAYGA